MRTSRSTIIASAIFSANAMLIISASTFAEDREALSKLPGQAADQLQTINSHSKRHIRVRCDRGESLSRAVQRAREHQTVRFSGICYESLVINKDHLTLLGENGATIDGSQSPSEAVLLIDAARGFELDSFTVQNGSDQGILATHQAQGVLKNIVAQGNAMVGISVDASHVQMTDVRATGNDDIGIDMFTGSTVIVAGDINTSDNAGDGMDINGNSTLELRGAVITSSNNGGNGLTLVNDSNFLILSFPEAQGSGVLAANNRGAAGIFIGNASLSVVGSQFAGSGANVFDISGNDVGMLIISSSLVSPFGTAKFNLTSNGTGMVITDNSQAIINGGLNVTGNFGPGIVADGAGFVRLQPNDANPSRVADNGQPADLLALFGTKVVVDDGVELGVVVCDPTVTASAGLCP